MKGSNEIVKKVLRLLLTLLVGLLTVSWGKTNAATLRYIQSSTPTIFVHGWGSSYHAEEKMVNAARQAGVTRTIVVANVTPAGKVTFNRPLPAKAVNPIVEVNLEDNKLTKYRNNYTKGYHHGGQYVKDVVLALEKQHHYATINLVGHSMGNLEIINYINDNAGNHNLPKINHLVAIAGHYNGLVGQEAAEQATLDQSGKPSWQDPSFRELLSLRKTFPRNTKVLNIYGDLKDGSHSDKDVPVNSAKSLRYLVAGRAKSYEEHQINGRMGQHSRLHNNNQVNQLLIKFLWTR